jgi:hypothetical protein
LDTRNALAGYASFGDWNKFKIKALAENKERFLLADPSDIEKEKTGTSAKTGTLFKWLVSNVLLLIALWIGIWFWPKPVADWTRVKIHVQNPIDTALLWWWIMK